MWKLRKYAIFTGDQETIGRDFFTYETPIPTIYPSMMAMSARIISKLNTSIIFPFVITKSAGSRLLATASLLRNYSEDNLNIFPSFPSHFNLCIRGRGKSFKECRF
jgi:hypothetical protein